MTAPLDLLAWRVWAFRAVYTQANAAGGAIVVDFTAGEGNTMIIMHSIGINSGTNGIKISRIDEDNTESALLNDIASAAATSGSVPRGFESVAAQPISSTLIDSTDPLTRTFSGVSDKFTVRQTVAGAANDTFTIDIRALVRHGVLPARTKARSTNQADVTETAPTINRMVT